METDDPTPETETDESTAPPAGVIVEQQAGVEPQVVTPVPAPLILTDAGIKINTKELACVTNHIELSPDVSITTLDTMCGSTDYPGVIKWALIATFYQSFDVDATESVLSAAVLAGVPVAFEITPYRSKAVSATNPKWTGTVVPQPYAPINGDAGDASTVEIEWAVVGAPVKAVT